MRRQAIVGALLLVGVGIALGATVFRADIAQATGVAQSVTIANTPAQAVPIKEQNVDRGGNVKTHEQGTANVNVTNGSLKVAEDLEPYEHSVFFNQTPGTCTQFFCSVGFPAVPLGKRLVVTYASAQYALTAGGSVAFVRLGVNGDEPQIDLPAPVPTGSNIYIASGPVTFYVNAGDAPTLKLEGQFVQPLSNTAHAAIVGHLVNLIDP